MIASPLKAQQVPALSVTRGGSRILFDRWLFRYIRRSVAYERDHLSLVALGRNVRHYGFMVQLLPSSP